jgi:hypothetical protein
MSSPDDVEPAAVDQRPADERHLAVASGCR